MTRREDDRRMLPYKTVCPVCFVVEARNSVDADFPWCPDCASEAMTVDVISLDQFLAERTVGDFDELLEYWARVDGLREQYRRSKLGAIERLRQRKLELISKGLM